MTAKDDNLIEGIEYANNPIYLARQAFKQMVDDEPDITTVEDCISRGEEILRIMKNDSK